MAPQSPRTSRQVTIERTFDATIEDVWELWTTKDGIESWWGPDGYSVTVGKLDLRPGGELLYAMTATAPDQIDFMKKSGMPLTTETRIKYREIVPKRRLAYTNVVDFVPGVRAYEVTTVVEFDAGAHGVRMVLTMDAMHDERWTQLAVMGWEQELAKLDRVLQKK
ncbi:MAG TPA: SRPBCC domain-containing protein [Candidatus Acidoferrum sp.]|nr:SRPBCC domain-containing protein [Candidatus Acidoferrum sp.]